MDPRLTARRRDVAEERARINVRRVVWLLVTLAAIGSAFWLASSPMLSVRTISVFGSENAPVSEILADQQVVEGRPLIAIRTGAVIDALLMDPWIRAANVELVFPSHVEVTIEERTAVAWVQLEGAQTRWALVADDGVVVAYGTGPTSEGAVIQLVSQDPGLGESVDTPEVIGSIQFILALPAHLSSQTSLRVVDGDLWAWVADRNVRLGQPIDMEAKAGALVAIIDSAPPGVIDLIAPTRPAVWSTDPTDGGSDVEGEVEQEGEGESFTVG